jgi:hypothetical protein
MSFTFWLSVTVPSVTRFNISNSVQTTPRFYHGIVPAFSLYLYLLHYSSCSARPPTQTDLTRRRSVLVGSVAVPHYPLSAPVALDITQVAVGAVVVPPLPHNVHLEQT